MRYANIALLCFLSAGCAEETPVPQPLLPVAETLEFSVFIQEQQALITYTGSAPVRSAEDFMGGASEALMRATGCGLIEASVETSDKAILGTMDCEPDQVAPLNARGASMRQSPRRGLGTPAKEPNEDLPLISEENDTTV